MESNPQDTAAFGTARESRGTARDVRPWGYFVVLCDEANHRVKRVVVNPGHRLSMQRHTHRSEHWHVVSGEALVTLEQRELRLAGGQSIDIPRGSWHRVMNTGPGELVFIEVQRGESFGEEDIERVDDDYGRA